MKKSFIFFFFFSLIFCIRFTYAQPGCPSIDAGPDKVVTCTNPCTTLNATVLATGLTNSYGVSSIPYNPPYPYNTGTPINVNIDDRWSLLINLPFTFCFYGINYSQIVAGSNGVVTFNAALASPSLPPTSFCPWSYTASCPSPSLITNAIFGVYHDIDPSVSGNMYYAILGSYPCRTFVVSWYNVAMYSCTSLKATHQIVLYESTNVIEVYIQNKPLCGSWNLGAGIVGIEDASGTIGLTAPGRNTTPTWTASNEAWRFTPNGTPNYTITWWDGGTQIGTGPSIQVCPTNTTTYTGQVVYDACSGLQVILNDQVTVTANNTINVNTSPAAISICPGQTTYLNASSSSPNTSFHWSDGTYNQFIGVSPTTTTVYTVTGTDNNGCEGTASATVTVNPDPVITVTPPSASICFGNSVTLDASSSNSGTSFSWSPGGPGSQITVSPSLSTNYIVVGTDTNNCTGSATVTVGVHPNPGITISPANPWICYGSNINLTASSSNSGTNYDWSTGGSGNTINVNPTIPTTYSVTGTDTYGCSGTASVTVSINPSLNIAISPAVTTICNGDSVQLIATGGVNYNWTPSTGLSGTNTASVWAFPNDTTTYTVNSSDNNGCTGSTTITVAVNPVPTSSFTVDSIACQLSSSTFTYTGTATPAATYTWNFAGGTAVPGTGQGPHEVNWSSQGTYNVSLTVTELNCTSSTTFQSVIVSNLSSTMSSTDVTCHGYADGTATVTPSNGITSYSYSWNTIPPQANQTANNLGPGTYTVLITDNAGCTASNSVTITEPTQLAATITGKTNVTCFGGNNGTATFTASGGIPPYTYTWSYGSSTSSSSSGFPAGNYTVTVKDSNNCQVIVPFTITQPALLTVNIPVHDEGCLGSCDGNLVANAGGGTQPYSYLWSTSATTIQINSLCVGNYSVTVTDSNHCTANGSASVGTNTLIEAAASSVPVVGLIPLSCSFYSNGTGAATYSWNFDDGDSSNLMNPSHTFTQEGVFTVTLTVNSGPPDFCEDVTSFTVTVILPSNVFVPNIVTPNDDNFNDVFKVKGDALETEQMVIFNRWGRKVYEWNEVGGSWDCKKESGGEYAKGTYYYNLYARGTDGIEYNLHGIFEVLK